MAKLIQAKHLPEGPILSFVAAADPWTNRWEIAREVSEINGAPEAVVLAKMRKLVKRGLVDGCGCGCRGDFTITERGQEFLAAQLEGTDG